MMCQELIDRLALVEAEVLKLHQSLAQAVQHAEQGWSRYENANRLANGYMEELAEIKALPVVAYRREWDGDVSDIGMWVYEEDADQLDNCGVWQALYALPPKE